VKKLEETFCEHTVGCSVLFFIPPCTDPCACTAVPLPHGKRAGAQAARAHRKAVPGWLKHAPVGCFRRDKLYIDFSPEPKNQSNAPKDVCEQEAGVCSFGSSGHAWSLELTHRIQRRRYNHGRGVEPWPRRRADVPAWAFHSRCASYFSVCSLGFSV